MAIATSPPPTHHYHKQSANGDNGCPNALLGCEVRMKMGPERQSLLSNGELSLSFALTDSLIMTATYETTRGDVASKPPPPGRVYLYGTHTATIRSLYDTLQDTPHHHFDPGLTLSFLPCHLTPFSTLLPNACTIVGMCVMATLF
jgi:hypothetical protein